MKKLFKLTAYNLTGGFVTEEAYFTSRKKAKESMSNLAEYLERNHELDTNRREIFGEDSVGGDKVVSWILDDRYNVSLVEHSLRTNILNY